MSGLELRQQAEDALNLGDYALAARALAELWRAEPAGPVAGFIASRLPQLRGQVPLISCKLAILRSFTVEPAVPWLQTSAFAAGIDVNVHLGEFNAYVQEVLDPASGLYAFRPDVVVLAVLARDLEIGSDLVERYRGWIRAFRQQSHAHLILHTLEQPLQPDGGLLEQQSSQGRAAQIARFNLDLRDLAREFHGVYVLDYDALIARHGRAVWHDERKWLTVRMPIAARHVADLAREWLRFLHPLTGRIAKVAAVDLDNTLWGGIIGEDGMAGIKLGAEYPGAAYQQLQHALLNLYHRGILLAVCSKNNPEDAMDALTKHPGMVLKPDHFAVLRINWQDKARNLREIATELNVGLDAIAFLDDNPVERQQVRDAAPEVAVIEMPSEPLRYAEAVRDCPLFERLTLSEEDRQRGELYRAERERRTSEAAAVSKEDFYRSLEQEVEIAPVTPMTLARVAQLTQKTNQFNVTTRRYSEQQIAELAARPGWQVLAMRVRDRYADNGLVGVAITRDEAGVCAIDTFLLSCRVIGRTVETALLGWIADEARGRGMRRLRGEFLPTRKNAPARDFYSDHGFAAVEGSMWELDLTKGTVPIPTWVRVTQAQEVAV